MTLAETFYKPSTSSEQRIRALLSAAFFNVIKSNKPAWYPEGPSDFLSISSPILTDFDGIDSTPLPSSAEEFSLFYEELVSYDALKKGGVFYTPPKIADLIIENCISTTDSNLLKSNGILDPSCGGGIFLVRAYNFLKESKEFTDSLENLNLLFGVDRDPMAAEVTKLSLMLAASDLESEPEEIYQSLSKQIFSGNSLVSPNEANSLTEKTNLPLFSLDSSKTTTKSVESYFDWHLNFSPVNNGGFACIIGNPPYGLSRGEQISKKENTLLKKLYSEFRLGKVNKYLLFIARGNQFLAKNGTISFIVPNSWLGIRSGSAIRKLLLEDLNLEEVSFFNGPVFPKASVETIIFKASKKQQISSISLSCRNPKEPDQIKHQGSLSKSFCLKELDSRIPLVWESKLEAALKKIYSNSIKLEDPASGLRSYIALQAYAVSKGKPPQTKEQVKSHCFHSETKIDETYYPYLEGKNIGRYKISPHKSYLQYGPWLAEPQKFERFDGPRILIREIVNRSKYMLYAAFIENAAFYNKSVLHILPQAKLKREVFLALTGVFNSSLASLILFLTGRKTQRALFPKIVNADLLGFPIPKAVLESPESLAALVLKNEEEKFQEEIDLKVAEAYGLNDSILTEISEFLDKSQKLLLSKSL